MRALKTLQVVSFVIMWSMTCLPLLAQVPPPAPARLVFGEGTITSYTLYEDGAPIPDDFKYEAGHSLHVDAEAEVANTHTEDDGNTNYFGTYTLIVSAHIIDHPLGTVARIPYRAGTNSFMLAPGESATITAEIKRDNMVITSFDPMVSGYEVHIHVEHDRIVDAALVEGGARLDEEMDERFLQKR